MLESVQALAGTTSCKGVQIARLREWAISNNCWIDRTTLGTYSDRGSENEVYTSLDSRCVNVLMGDDGKLYFIDTIIFKSDTGGLETYNSLSPRASKSSF